jgi:hypothetical protein
MELTNCLTHGVDGTLAVCITTVMTIVVPTPFPRLPAAQSAIYRSVRPLLVVTANGEALFESLFEALLILKGHPKLRIYGHGGRRWGSSGNIWSNFKSKC